MTRGRTRGFESLMQKPGWQLALMLAGSLVFIAFMVYQCLLSNIWRQQRELEQQINDLQRVVNHAQIALLQVSPMSRLEQILKESALVDNDFLPLDQQFAQPLKTSQAVLVRWSPASGAQGELHLQAPFSSLIKFLQALLQRPSHPTFSAINLRTSDHGLAVSLLLTQPSGIVEKSGEDIAMAPERDPFTSTSAQHCANAAISLPWSLVGLTQAAGQPSGWLLSPDGRWSKVEAGMRIGTPEWTVEMLDATQVGLSISDVRCGEQRQALRFGHQKDSSGEERQ